MKYVPRWQLRRNNTRRAGVVTTCRSASRVTSFSSTDLASSFFSRVFSTTGSSWPRRTRSATSRSALPTQLNDSTSGKIARPGQARNDRQFQDRKTLAADDSRHPRHVGDAYGQVFSVNYSCRFGSTIFAGSGCRGSRSTSVMPVGRMGTTCAVQSGVGNAPSRRNNLARRPARVFHATGAIHRLLSSRNRDNDTECAWVCMSCQRANTLRRHRPPRRSRDRRAVTTVTPRTGSEITRCGPGSGRLFERAACRGPRRAG